MKWCNLTLTYFLEIWEKIIHQKMYFINNCDWVEQFIRRTLENGKTDTECHQFLVFNLKQWIAHHSNAPIINKLLHQDSKIFKSSSEASLSLSLSPHIPSPKAQCKTSFIWKCNSNSQQQQQLNLVFNLQLNVQICLIPKAGQHKNWHNRH